MNGRPMTVRASWRRVTAYKHHGRDRVREHAALLRPGLWLLSDVKRARHWRCVATPSHLRQTRLGSRARRGDRSAKLGMRLLRAVTPPLVTWVPRHAPEQPNGGGTGSGYPLLLPTQGGSTLLFDAGERRILHIRSGSPVDEAYIKVRDLLSRHLRTPAYEVSADRLRITEELVEGRSFHTLPARQRRAVVATVFGWYTSLCREARQGDSRSLLQAAIDAVMSTPTIPADLKSLLDRSQGWLLQRAERWPLLPSHGDLHGKNLIVGESGEVTVIDLEYGGLRPFFHDPLLLLVWDARHAGPEILRTALEGGMDEQLRPLFAAAGLALRHEDLYACLLSAALVFAYGVSLPDGRLDRDSLTETVMRNWRPLRGILPAAHTDRWAAPSHPVAAGRSGQPVSDRASAGFFPGRR